MPVCPGLASQPCPGTGSGLLSLPTLTRHGWGQHHLPDADSAQPSSTTILLLGGGTWHLGAQLLGTLASGSSAPCPASEGLGPGPSWPQSTSSSQVPATGSCHLLLSEHQAPPHFHSADYPLGAGGSGQAWLLEPLSPPLPAHPRPPRGPRSMRQPRTEKQQSAGFQPEPVSSSETWAVYRLTPQFPRLL